MKDQRSKILITTTFFTFWSGAHEEAAGPTIPHEDDLSRLLSTPRMLHTEARAHLTEEMGGRDQEGEAQRPSESRY